MWIDRWKQAQDMRLWPNRNKMRMHPFSVRFTPIKVLESAAYID